MIFQRKGSGVSWLLVGLGNPGSKYESTRHNMGFLAVDGLARRKGFRFNKLRFRAWTAEWMVNGEKVLVMKPQTYMNLSGESVGEAARFYQIPADHVVVISDDISLPVGRLPHPHRRQRRRPQRPEEHHPASGNRSVPPHQGGGRRSRGRRAMTWWTGSSAAL